MGHWGLQPPLVNLGHLPTASSISKHRHVVSLPTCSLTISLDGDKFSLPAYLVRDLLTRRRARHRGAP